MDAIALQVRIGAKDVRFGAFGDSDDGIGIEDGRAFHPGTHGIATAKLLSLPRAERLKGVRGKNKRNLIKLFGKEAGHRRVPSMRMDDVDAGEGFHLRQIEAQSLESTFEFAFSFVGNLAPRFAAANVEISVIRMLPAPTMDLHGDFLSQLAAQVIDMDPCSP